MPLSRLVSHKHPCEMRGKKSGIALAVNRNVTKEVFRTAEKETEREFVVLKQGE
jgi:hypothetical protein